MCILCIVDVVWPYVLLDQSTMMEQDWRDGCVAVVVMSCIFVVIALSSSFWCRRSPPGKVTIDWMLAEVHPGQWML